MPLVKLTASTSRGKAKERPVVKPNQKQTSKFNKKLTSNPVRPSDGRFEVTDFKKGQVFTLLIIINKYIVETREFTEIIKYRMYAEFNRYIRNNL